MSPDRLHTERTREEDKSRPARFRVCFQKWKDLLVAAVLIPTALATVVLGLEQRGYSKARADDTRVVRIIAQQRARDAQATAAAARLSCLRSRRLGPPLADYYARDPEFPRDVLAEYRRTIPTSCPK